MEFWQLLALGECRNSRYAESVGFPALRTGRLHADRNCAAKVPKVIASFKFPSTQLFGKRSPNPYLPALVV